MFNLFFSPMRNACAVFFTSKNTPQPILQEEDSAATDTIAAEPEPIVAAATDSLANYTPQETFAIEPNEWTRRLYLKTNAIGWGLAITNIAAEVDMARHWSFSLPAYWSSWNYFKSTLKFRTLSLQPEIRYWLSENNDGWFVGTHFGLGWYNFATDGGYRTQDHDGNSPATGGGVAAGYRLPISSDKRWKIEFSLGAGIYKVHYDKFHNESNGLLTRTEKKTWFGIDQAAISFAYTFNLGRKKGDVQ